MVLAALLATGCEDSPSDIRLEPSPAKCTPAQVPDVERLTKACATMGARGEDEDRDVSNPECLTIAVRAVCGEEWRFRYGKTYSMLPCSMAKEPVHRAACEGRTKP